MCKRMRLDFVCAENVQHFRPARFEVIRDKRAMATPPDCFRAHDGGRARSDGFRSRYVLLQQIPKPPLLDCNVEQSLDSFLELLRLHVIGITAE